MRVEFKHPRQIDRKLYPKGIHDLPKDMRSHWYFKALAKAKDIKVMEDDGKELKKKVLGSNEEQPKKAQEKAPVASEE